MKLQPNTQLSYKDGKRRITVWLQNVNPETGLIFFNVNIKQATGVLRAVAPTSIPKHIRS